MKKKLILIASIVMISLNVFADNVKAVISANLLPFKEVVVNVPSRIKVYQGDEFKISIRCKDDVIRDNIDYKLTNDSVLVISTPQIDNIETLSNDVRIVIVTPKDIEVRTSSSYMMVSASASDNN